MIELGKYNDLRIYRETSIGLYLGEEETEEEDILLPTKYCPREFKIHDILSVFVYLDSEDRIIATNLRPKIVLHEFAFMQVSAITSVGAFLDWGLEKELMVPYREQRQNMEEGRWYIVFMDIDEKTNRLYATNKFEKRLSNENVGVKSGEEVDLLVYRKSDLGFSVIVNNKYKGLIFANEIFREINIGEKLKGFVKNIRDDNKVDISLQRSGYENVKDANTELVYGKLIENNGFLALTDKSSPDAIYAQFGISKKAFKKSIGDLYKQRKISIGKEGISLVEGEKSLEED